jgi:hypothetical protein
MSNKLSVAGECNVDVQKRHFISVGKVASISEIKMDMELVSWLK